MKRVLAASLGYPLFYLGHAISKAMHLPMCHLLYRPYNWCMLRSLELNDWGGLELWSQAPEIRFVASPSQSGAES